MLTELETTKKALRKFCLKHFNLSDEDLELLDGGIFDLIITEYDLEGISEYDLIDIVDSELAKALDKVTA